MTPARGLLNPNHFLSAAIAYLFGGGREWGSDVGVGKTLVSSSMIDRVVADLRRRLFEVPVGFEVVVDGLVDGSIGFGGEESAGASFLRRDGTVGTTDKDGIIAVLACELTARTGQDPGVAYGQLTERSGRPSTSESIPRDTGAEGARRTERVRCDGQGARRRTDQRDPDRGTSNGAPIGGLKVTTESGWFAARPSRLPRSRGELRGRGPPRATLAEARPSWGRSPQGRR